MIESHGEDILPSCIRCSSKIAQQSKARFVCNWSRSPCLGAVSLPELGFLGQFHLAGRTQLRGTYSPFQISRSVRRGYTQKRPKEVRKYNPPHKPSPSLLPPHLCQRGNDSPIGAIFRTLDLEEDLQSFQRTNHCPANCPSNSTSNERCRHWLADVLAEAS
jgi:hypothetical protein